MAFGACSSFGSNDTPGPTTSDASAPTSIDGAPPASQGGGCTPDLLFCDDFDHAGFSELWSLQLTGTATFTLDGGLERSPIDGAPSAPNTLLAYSVANGPAFIEGPRLVKKFSPGDYATLRVRFDMLIERWEPSDDKAGCCAFWPFQLASTFDAGTYVLGVGENELSWRLDHPSEPVNPFVRVPLFDHLKVGVWTHIDVVISGKGDARAAILRVDGAKQATLQVPADFPRPEAPLDFIAGITSLVTPATARIRLDNVAVDTK
jgi:hypothetical protein